MSKTKSRNDSLSARKSWTPEASRPDRRGQGNLIERVFGVNTFGLRQMKSRLSAAVYKQMEAAIAEGRRLDEHVADAVAIAMKEWALSRGATHYTHWFQPLTGRHGREARLLPEGGQGRPRHDRVSRQRARSG